MEAALYANAKLNTILTVKDIVEIHKIALHRVTGTNFGEETKAGLGETAKGRAGKNMYFGLGSKNTSCEGMIELLTDIKTGNKKYVVEVNKTINADYLKNYSDTKITKLAKNLLKTPRIKLETRNICTYMQDLEVALTQYHGEIEAAKKVIGEKQQRLKKEAIAKFCREGVRIHPFLDGNGRVFCMIIPYFLCQQEGFPIPLMRDMNTFTNYSISEIVTEMEQGFENADKLLQGKVNTGFSRKYDYTEEDTLKYISKICCLVYSNQTNIDDENDAQIKEASSVSAYVEGKNVLHRLFYSIMEMDEQNILKYIGEIEEKKIHLDTEMKNAIIKLTEEKVYGKDILSKLEATVISSGSRNRKDRRTLLVLEKLNKFCQDEFNRVRSISGFSKSGLDKLDNIQKIQDNIKYWMQHISDPEKCILSRKQEENIVRKLIDKVDSTTLQHRDKIFHKTAGVLSLGLWSKVPTSQDNFKKWKAENKELIRSESYSGPQI
jgi:flagellar biosynthesis chaperone FliJ